ncbi:MAG: Asp23/Gls24 family envelope stress response protein [Lachnospiraceae bacterium]|nr:Asp23/Gls24 family envelope stress response protein [Lachnospiraceae bacterium]
MAKENGSKFISLERSPAGDIRIADDVVAVIAGLAAMEVEGVAAMAGNVTTNIMNRVGMKTLSKGVRVFIENTFENEEEEGTCSLRIDLAIIVRYGYAIPAICSSVQDKVKSTVETMVGFGVTDVNIRIAGVASPAVKREG